MLDITSDLLRLLFRTLLSLRQFFLLLWVCVRRQAEKRHHLDLSMLRASLPHRQQVRSSSRQNTQPQRCVDSAHTVCCWAARAPETWWRACDVKDMLCFDVMWRCVWSRCVRANLKVNSWIIDNWNEKERNRLSFMWKQSGKDKMKTDFFKS